MGGFLSFIRRRDGVNYRNLLLSLEYKSEVVKSLGGIVKGKWKFKISLHVQFLYNFRLVLYLQVPKCFVIIKELIMYK